MSEVFDIRMQKESVKKIEVVRLRLRKRVKSKVIA